VATTASKANKVASSNRHGAVTSVDTQTSATPPQQSTVAAAAFARHLHQRHLARTEPAAIAPARRATLGDLWELLAIWGTGFAQGVAAVYVTKMLGAPMLVVVAAGYAVGITALLLTAYFLYGDHIRRANVPPPSPRLLRQLRRFAAAHGRAFRVVDLSRRPVARDALLSSLRRIPLTVQLN
jgi:hypothetical protein